MTDNGKPHCWICGRLRITSGICGACKAEGLFLDQIQAAIEREAQHTADRATDNQTTDCVDGREAYGFNHDDDK